MRKPLVGPAAAMIAGVMMAEALPLPEARLLVGLALAVGLAAVLLWRGRLRTTALALLLSAVFLGALHATMRKPRTQPRHVAGHVPSGGAICRFEADVLDAPLAIGHDDKAQMFLLRARRILLPSGWTATDGRVQLQVRGTIQNEPNDPNNPKAPDPALVPGDRVILTAFLERPQPPAYPGAFDYRAYLSRREIFVVGWMVAPETVTRADSTASLRRALYRARQGLLRGVRAAVSEPESVLLAAMLIGERRQLTATRRGAFDRSGTGHLLSISGLHLVMLALGAHLLLTWLGAGSKTKAVVIIILAVSYAAVAGGRVPVVRAAIMTFAYLAGLLLDREASSFNTLSLAAVLVMLWQPSQVLAAGFQLSFVAVAFIIAVVPPLQAAFKQWLEQRRRPATSTGRFLRGAGERIALTSLVSTAAWLGVAPLIWHYFGTLAPYAVAANVLALPLAFVVLCLGVPAVIFSALIPALGPVLGWVPEIALRLLEGLSSFFADLPGGRVAVPSPGRVWIGLYYLALGGVVAHRTLGVRLPRALIAAAGVLVAFLIWQLVPRDKGRFRITALTDRSGHAQLVSLPGADPLLIDAGLHGRGLVDALRHAGVTRLEALVLTADTRTVMRGAQSVVESLAVGRVFLPRSSAPSADLLRLESSMRSRGIPAVYAAAGDRLGPLGGGQSGADGDPTAGWLEFLSPQQASPWSLALEGRAAPAVLAVRQGRHRFLFVPGSSRGVLETAMRAGGDVRADLVMLRLPARPARNLSVLLDRSGARLAIIVEQDRRRLELPPATARRRRLTLSSWTNGTLRVTVLDDGTLAVDAYQAGAWRKLGAVAP